MGRPQAGDGDNDEKSRSDDHDARLGKLQAVDKRIISCH